MESDRLPVIITEIGDICIRTVLDNGFISSSELAPEVHAHAFYELLVAIEGKIAVDIQNVARGGSTILMNTGESCLIPPGIYHATRGASDFPAKLALRFGCARLEKRGNSSVFEDATRALFSYAVPKILSPSAGIYDLTCELRREINSGGIASREYIGVLLSQLYIRLFRLLDVDGEGKSTESAISADGDDSRQIQIEEYIFTHLCEQITEENLAREMHLSKRQLSRVLRQLFGKSFRQMLIEARLNRAAQLLCETDLSVEEIATQVGYTSLSGFYTAFRGRFSLSVGQYRRAFKVKK